MIARKKRFVTQRIKKKTSSLLLNILASIPIPVNSVSNVISNPPTGGERSFLPVEQKIPHPDYSGIRNDSLSELFPYYHLDPEYVFSCHLEESKTRRDLSCPFIKRFLTLLKREFGMTVMCRANDFSPRLLGRGEILK
jgi:hypothetical protein